MRGSRCGTLRGVPREAGRWGVRLRGGAGLAGGSGGEAAGSDATGQASHAASGWGRWPFENKQVSLRSSRGPGVAAGNVGEVKRGLERYPRARLARVQRDWGAALGERELGAAACCGPFHRSWWEARQQARGRAGPLTSREVEGWGRGCRLWGWKTGGGGGSEFSLLSFLVSKSSRRMLRVTRRAAAKEPRSRSEEGP